LIDVALVTFVEMPEGWVDDHLLAAALRERGLATEFVCWDDPDARWASAGVVVIRSPWDYHRRLGAFLDWADYVGSVTQLWNPPSIVRWNCHKGYLVELEARGVPIVPTRLLRAGEHASLGAGEHVVKPAVSIGADRTVRHASQADLDALVATDDVLVQPYLSEIETEGEVSIVCVRDEPTHAVRKVPAPGDFRSQEHLGARLETIPLAPAHRSLAEAALAVVDGSTLYARADAVLVDGELRLMELELIEPTLWLEWHPPAAGVLADAVAQLLRT
jgi:glutathione synthase/RimK-type ligase-like ATP-grasp enzyme